MQADEFYSLVQQASHLESTERTRVVTAAVLETLGETLTGGEAEAVATQLPTELAGVLEDTAHDGAGYDREAFEARVGEHLRETDASTDDAGRYVDAVTDALAVTVRDDELENHRPQLSGGLQPLFEDDALDCGDA